MEEVKKLVHHLFHSHYNAINSASYHNCKVWMNDAFTLRRKLVSIVGKQGYVYCANAYCLAQNKFAKEKGLPLEDVNNHISIKEEVIKW